MDHRHGFGLRLRIIRTERNLTQEQLAAMIDRSVEAVSNLERGASLPSLGTLLRLSECLAIPLRDLVEALDPTVPADPQRATLEATLVEAARRLSLRDLEVAVRQVQAFLRD